MKLNNQRRHYVAVIPLWLARTLSENGLPLETALDFNALAAIISTDDVCFYYHYLTKKDIYTDEVFSDMENILHKENNVNWAVANEDHLKKNLSTFTISFDKCSADLTGSGTPLTVRKTPYRPMAIGDDTLMLIATDGDMGYSRTDFYSDCMAELSKQMSHGCSVQFGVFKHYTLS